MKYNISILFLLLTLYMKSQNTEPATQDLKINQFVKGTLVKPAVEKPPLAILIQGSGPTDRNGNQAFARNDSFKKLAHALADEGIASYRYDKRILRNELNIQENNIRFDDFVDDASTVVDHFANSEEFGRIVVVGHSQGSLVGILAAKNNVQGFVSIAGAAQPIDSIITQQIILQMPGLAESVRESFRDLRKTGSSGNYNPMLESIFRPSVQPFILSWMKYNPQDQIQELNIPVLLINGSKDLQVGEREAHLLKEAHPGAQIIILENMNHVLRKIEGDGLENSKSYNEPQLPLHPELVPQIADFIKSLE